MQRNDKVYFGRRNGEKTKGTIIKVLPSGKFKVRQDEERGTQRSHPIGTIWTVPPSGCWLQDESQAAPEPLPVRTVNPISSGDEPIYANMFQDNATVHILMAILAVHSDLSPEALTADGELPVHVVRRRSTELHQKLNHLQAALGRKVSETVVWKWYEEYRKISVSASSS